jgi:hypothetical protein
VCGGGITRWKLAHLCAEVVVKTAATRVKRKPGMQRKQRKYPKACPVFVQCFLVLKSVAHLCARVVEEAAAPLRVVPGRSSLEVGPPIGRLGESFCSGCGEGGVAVNKLAYN